MKDLVDAIIFDFDGVIANSVDIKTEAFASIYRSFGDQIVEKVVLHHKNNAGVSRFDKFKYYHKEYLGIEINIDEINNLSKEFQNLVLQKVIDAPFINGTLNFLNKFYDKIPMYVISATPNDEICYIVEKKNLSKYFKSVHGSPKDKSYWTSHIINKYYYNPNNMIFVGDGLQDHDAAKNNNLNFVGRVDSLKNNIFENKNVDFLIEDLTYLQNSIECIVNNQAKESD